MTAPGTTPDDSPSPAEIERQIERSRADLTLTLDAIERKLMARHLLGKGFEMVRDTFGTNEAINRGLDVIRANPVPVALIGIGAAWLIASNSNVVDRLAHDERIAAAGRRVADLASDIGNRAGELASDVAGRVGIGSSASSGQALGHTGNRMVDESNDARPEGWVHQVTDIAQDALRSVRDSGGALINRAGNYAGTGAGRVSDQLSDAFERHPLIVGGIGIMAGALIAALLPVTRAENEWLGDTRDALWNKTQEAGEHALSQVREAATRAVDAVTSTAAETVKGLSDKPSPT